MKRRLISRTAGFDGGQACIVVPLLIEKLDRSVWPGAPSQRGNGVDDTPEATVGPVRFVVRLASVLVGTEAPKRFRPVFVVFEWAIISRGTTQMRVRS